MSERHIFFYGGEGVGKTPMINKLLGVGLIPGDQTQTVIEIRHENRDVFRATTEFVREKVFSMVVGELCSKAERHPVLEKLLEVHDGERPAHLKKRITQLHRRKDKIPERYSTYLKQGSIESEFADVEELHSHLLLFGHRLQPFWPIVRCIRIYGPFKAISPGTVLFDLPLSRESWLSPGKNNTIVVVLPPSGQFIMPGKLQRQPGIVRVIQKAETFKELAQPFATEAEFRSAMKVRGLTVSHFLEQFPRFNKEYHTLLWDRMRSVIMTEPTAVFKKPAPPVQKADDFFLKSFRAALNTKSFKMRDSCATFALEKKVSTHNRQKNKIELTLEWNSFRRWLCACLEIDHSEIDWECRLTRTAMIFEFKIPARFSRDIQTNKKLLFS